MAVGVADARVPVIRTQGLSKIYSAGTEAEVAALRGVDLVIDRGEFVAIMGPSGSGKSTLMNLIGCLDTPTAGKYFCDGVDVSTLDKEELATLRRDKIGFVFQGFHLLTRMDATDNVAMPLGYARIPPSERKERARAALASVGLAERAGIARTSCPAASSNASRSPVRWSTSRRSCWPTNPPARSTARPARKSWRCSSACATTATRSS